MKKGFTLIELLAVIVILAIIALIATPIVLNIINESKKNARLRSAEMYIKGLETSIATATLHNKVIKDDQYNIIEDGNICLKYSKDNINVCEEKLEIEMNGEVPNSGTITIQNGQIKDVNLEYENKNTIVINDKGDLSYVTHKNGKIVYFDVEKGIGCTEKDYDSTNSNTGYNGFKNKSSEVGTTFIQKLETQNSCLKFYAFNDNGSDTINLLLDHNTTPYISWNSSGNNLNGPNTVISQLGLDTADWKGTNKILNYTVKQEGSGNYVINYDGYNARLITANEIAKITGNKNFNELTTTLAYGEQYYFDSNSLVESSSCKNGNTTECKYGWLYDRTSSSCTNYGCLNNTSTGMPFGYWTSTSVANVNNGAWIVGYYSASLSMADVIYGGSYHTDGIGIRPVIEVLKSKL